VLAKPAAIDEIDGNRSKSIEIEWDSRLASGLQTGCGYPWSLSGVPTAEICMAEIRIEPRRRSMVWLWIVLALIIAGGLVYYFLYYRNGAT
jgi:hypothetical protein